jgi:hypothetical protein
MIRKDIDAFINEVKKYGIELALTSYTPGGIITEPFVSKMGDEEPPYYPGENFMWIFDHRKAVKLNKIPEYKNYPEKNAAYKLIVRGKEYTGRNPLIKPDSSKYKHWHYRNKLVLVFNPPMPDFTKASYPLEFKKVKGNGGEILYGKEVHYMPPPIGRHREIVKQQAAANNIAFLDILGAFERVAESVGETLYTPGYEMRHGHPWWKMLDSKSRKMTLLLASDKALPARKDIFEAIINGEKRYFTVLSVNKAAKSVKLYSVESPNGEYIYPGDLETIPNRDSLWKNTEYKKVSGKGTVKSFIPIGILLITDAVRPIKMNYMSNYFSRKDGHHLASPAINLMFEIMKDVIFSNSTYVKNRPEHQRLRK